jgi:hypothetical protein
MGTMTDEVERICAKLGDVLDIIAAAEMEFARTEAHHAYYSDRHAALNEAIERLVAIDEGMRKAAFEEGYDIGVVVGVNQGDAGPILGGKVMERAWKRSEALKSGDQ